MSNDRELLQRYAQVRDELAFSAFVGRHLALVYHAALRRTNGRRDLAEEVAQRVFTELACKAGQLAAHPALVAWLHRSTRFAAIDAVRAEARRARLGESYAAMPDDRPDVSDEHWLQLRPVIDAALDALSERDRQVLLLRFFDGRSYAEVGVVMDVNENAARMRTERALERLRTQLARRGITSSAAALALAFGSQAVADVPAGLAASVSASALAAGAACAGSVVAGTFFMTKILAPLASAALAAGETATHCVRTAPASSAAETVALQAERAALMQAAATSPTPPSGSLAAVSSPPVPAGAVATSAPGVGRASLAASAGAGSVAASGVTPRGHRNHGIATPHEAALTFAWAGDISDPDEFARIVTFDPAVRQRAVEILATMPESLRNNYPTPEAFFGLLLAVSTLEGPPPGPDVIESQMTMAEVNPNRYAMRRRGTERNIHEYELTDAGWKYVLPIEGVENLPRLAKSPTLTRLLGEPTSKP